MKKIMLLMIKIYKKTLSKLFYFMGIRCKYYPTCSDYMAQAIEKYGCLKGSLIRNKKIFKV